MVPNKINCKTWDFMRCWQDVQGTVSINDLRREWFSIVCLEPWTRHGVLSEWNLCLDSLKHNNRNSLCLTTLLFFYLNTLPWLLVVRYNLSFYGNSALLTRQQSLEAELNKTVKSRVRLTAYSCLMLNLHNFDNIAFCILYSAFLQSLYLWCGPYIFLHPWKHHQEALLLAVLSSDENGPARQTWFKYAQAFNWSNNLKKKTKNTGKWYNI